MTQDEWDRATPEKRVLHQFLAAMRECFRPDGTPMRGSEFRKAMCELVGANGVPAVDPVQAERERCARIADDEARIREEAGQKHVEGSLARERCFAGARAAANVAKGVRNGEDVPSSAPLVLPHPIGTIFSDGYWNLNVDLRDPGEVEPRWRNRGHADVYTADQVREILRTSGVDTCGTCRDGGGFTKGEEPGELVPAACDECGIVGVALPRTEQEKELGACSTSRATIGDRTHDRATEESNRGAGEEEQRGRQAGRRDATRAGSAESGARGSDAVQHEVKAAPGPSVPATPGVKGPEHG